MTFIPNPSQDAAIDFYKGCCNVMAGAGSGKTGVLVHRIKNLIEIHQVKPENILAITFSKKARDNMSGRLLKLIPDEYEAVNVHTFHSLGMKLLVKFVVRGFKVLDSDFDRLKILRVFEPDIEEPNEVLSYISLRKNNLHPSEASPTTYEGRMCALYEKEKAATNSIDFDDMLYMACELLKENPTALEFCHNRYRFIMVDEFQDTNRAQMEMLKLIVGANGNLFVVGDMMQNVFEWRGSNNEYIRDFHKDWPNTTVINLDTNYRSTDNIVKFANNFAQTINDSRHPHYVESVAKEPSYKDPELAVYHNQFDEARGVADKIKELMSSDNYEYKDFAVLARTNAQLHLLAANAVFGEKVSARM